MTIFLRLLTEKDKQNALANAVRNGGENVFEVDAASFCQIPGVPFAYWVSDRIRLMFKTHRPFKSEERLATRGASTCDDFRYVRVWWEAAERQGKSKCRWVPFTKGGSFSRFYSDIQQVVDWDDVRETFRGFVGRPGRWLDRPEALDYYFRPALTWPLRGISFSAQLVPKGCIFSVGGKVALAPKGELLALAGIFNSGPLDHLVRLFAGKVGGVQYETGLINQLPIPKINENTSEELSCLAKRGWSIRRSLDSVIETSHAFLLPAAIRGRLGEFSPATVELELKVIQAKVDAIAFDLYGLTEADCLTLSQIRECFGGEEDSQGGDEDESNSEDEKGSEIDLPSTDTLLSWAVGVAFGRFDWRLATGEREAPSEPEPFDPLPAKSPGMLPDGATPFHAHAGILVDDPGHPNDLARLMEEALVRVDAPVPFDVRRWLQRDFFAFHLQRYSKSRRKAPIYWPLATTSGSYTLWVYYPSLSSQTLYTAINDFIEPKLKQVGNDVVALRNKGAARSREEEKQFESLQTFELELMELRDTLLKLAPTYKPNRDDGVQITAAPLWPLFRYKPWQKVIKDTWAKLEKGDFNWAHLAMNYWPECVREKCKSDKSLAIAHGLEDLYVEPEGQPKKARDRKKVGGAE
ncbi:type II restriction enzyme, methylase subunit [Cupriavidus necator N-1]|uniref:Type II restriction enzyme, methylase subunit n=1 Tax=Cupriavidus necator (strain ATCC 43291 / DSM 13513 / CCUG 52238 / LMG 8453 / N-1) TaxID=1042878 RepID=G0EY16_CUPNN|nr:hypothetical protein [Cupriavidus necator]AEI78629.1 type II restriction enzyme, methylase subunit [Cupriavidus necator N-1]MDX6012848.1 type II restriction endonuclease subunit M [Cupriavidus necator]